MCTEDWFDRCLEDALTNQVPRIMKEIERRVRVIAERSCSTVDQVMTDIFAGVGNGNNLYSLLERAEKELGIDGGNGDIEMP